MTPEDICAEECTVDYDFVPPCDFIPTEDMVCGQFYHYRTSEKMLRLEK